MRKECLIHFSAALCCAAVLSAVYAVFGLYPFGGKTLSWCDMSQQVIPLLMEMKDVFAGKAGWFLNMQNAGGMSFWGVFFFFLASPLHLSVLFVEKPDIYLLVNVLVLIKLSLSAASASVFFRREAPSLPILAHFGLCIGYGLCGYGLLYYQNLVWLDMLYLFPLTMLGFIRLIEEEKPGLFTLCLALSLIFNYYLSYMLLLGMIICGAVFIFRYAPKERRGRLAGKLGLSAAAALSVTAVVWLPSLLQCLSSARTGGGVIQSVQSGGMLTKLSATLPVLLCTVGAAAPLFAPSKSAKAGAIRLCWGLTSLPVLIEPINKLWHLGSYQAFPVRYGYMPVFLGLWYLALGLNAPEENTAGAVRRKKFWLALALTLAAAAGAYILCARFEEISSYTSTLWLSEEGFRYLFIFWLACLMVLLVVCRSYAGTRRLSSWALLGLVLLQSAVQIPAFMGSAANIPSRSLAVLSAAPIDDGGLYRVKQESKFCHVNLLGGMGYPTLNHYTSLTDARYLAAMKKLGYSSYWMETSGCCGTAVSDILMSNKYILGGDMSWTPTGSGGLGYIVPAGLLPESLELGDRIELQDSLCRSLSGRSLFTRYEPIEGKILERDGKIALDKGAFRYQIRVSGRKTLYFDAFDCISTNLREAINDCFSIKVNGEEAAESYPTQRCNGILSLGSFENETVSVEVTVHKRAQLCSFGIWGLDDVRPLADSLVDAGLRYENGGISGSVRAQPGQGLFLSVPWYDGMKVKVNGQPVRPRQVLDCFMEIPLPEGQSTVEVSYIPAGLLPGAAASAVSLALLILCRLPGMKRLAARAKGLWYRCAPLLLGLGFGAVILAVYLFPVIVWLAGAV